ncbi:hypothetical protein MPSEU_000628100 [Mayamaea pseudoterrestris]|nr:hypothetical protein MPSEU_000628100 [Mayamaea pseudoterrestris]
MKSSRDKKEQRELRKFALFLYDKPMYDKSLQAIAWKKVTRLEYYQQLLTEKELAAYLWYDFHFGDKGYPREDSIRAILNLLVERAAEYQLTMTKLFEFLFKNGMNFRQCKTQSESDVTDGKVTMVSKSMAPCNWYIRGESDIADCLWEALFATLPELDSANGPLPIMPAPGQGPSTASGFSCGVYKAANLDDLALGSTLFIASILAEAKKDDNDIRAGALLASDSMFCHMRFSPNSYLKTHKFTLHGCRDGEYDRYKDSLMYQVVLVELQEVEKLRRKEFKRQGLKDEALQSKLLLLSKKVFIILQCYNGSQEAGVDADGKVIGDSSFRSC